MHETLHSKRRYLAAGQGRVLCSWGCLEPAISCTANECGMLVIVRACPVETPSLEVGHQESGGLLAWSSERALMHAHGDQAGVMQECMQLASGEEGGVWLASRAIRMLEPYLSSSACHVPQQPQTDEHESAPHKACLLLTGRAPFNAVPEVCTPSQGPRPPPGRTRYRAHDTVEQGGPACAPMILRPATSFLSDPRNAQSKRSSPVCTTGSSATV